MTASSLPPLLFYCQHSLGMGHLVRSLTLAGALAERFHVVLLSGGALPDCVQLPSSIEVLELPPIGLDDGRQLVSRSETGLAEAQLQRQQMILNAYSSLRPSAVVIELFPFGRKKFAAELLPLLEQAMNDPSFPVVVCSLRDILVARSDHDIVTSVERANRYFDAILVHSDPTFARLEESFHSPTPLHVPIHYTGFVTTHSQPRPASEGASRPRIVVSAGGGIVGETLFRTAAQAFQLLRATNDMEMKLIAGPFLPQTAWERLREMVDGWEGLRLERSVPELLPELFQASASISQCGYNTTLEVLRSRIPALVVPFEEGRETEQTSRARKLAGVGALRMLRETEMTAHRLADEIQALLKFRPKDPNLNFQGAVNSVRIIDELVSNRRCSQSAELCLGRSRGAAR
jgi:predicted glycosyltransferase